MTSDVSGSAGVRSRRTRRTSMLARRTPVGGAASPTAYMCCLSMATVHSFEKQAMEHQGALSRFGSSLTVQSFGSEWQVALPSR